MMSYISTNPCLTEQDVQTLAALLNKVAQMPKACLHVWENQGSTGSGIYCLKKCSESQENGNWYADWRFCNSRLSSLVCVFHPSPAWHYHHTLNCTNVISRQQGVNYEGKKQKEGKKDKIWAWAKLFEHFHCPLAPFVSMPKPIFFWDSHNCLAGALWIWAISMRKRHSAWSQMGYNSRRLVSPVS